MRMITLVYLMLVSTLLAAQEKEIWACQDTETNGIFWENGKWVPKLVNTNNWLLTVDGLNSSVKFVGDDYPMECSNYRSVFGAYYSCTDGYWTVVLNPATGAAGFSKMLGAIFSLANDSRDSVTVSVAQCTKF